MGIHFTRAEAGIRDCIYHSTSTAIIINSRAFAKYIHFTRPFLPLSHVRVWEPDYINHFVAYIYTCMYKCPWLAIQVYLCMCVGVYPSGFTSFLLPSLSLCSLLVWRIYMGYTQVSTLNTHMHVHVCTCIRIYFLVLQFTHTGEFFTALFTR